MYKCFQKCNVHQNMWPNASKPGTCRKISFQGNGFRSKYMLKNMLWANLILFDKLGQNIVLFHILNILLSIIDYFCLKNSFLYCFWIFLSQNDVISWIWLPLQPTVTKKLKIIFWGNLFRIHENIVINKYLAFFYSFSPFSAILNGFVL